MYCTSASSEISCSKQMTHVKDHTHPKNEWTKPKILSFSLFTQFCYTYVYIITGCALWHDCVIFILACKQIFGNAMCFD
jgi:hypothetical protein